MKVQEVVSAKEVADWNKIKIKRKVVSAESGQGLRKVGGRGRFRFIQLINRKIAPHHYRHI